MRKLRLLLAFAPLALGGCIALSDTTPPKPTTVVIPAPAAPSVVCANGTAPPCY